MDIWPFIFSAPSQSYLSHSHDQSMGFIYSIRNTLLKIFILRSFTLGSLFLLFFPFFLPWNREKCDPLKSRPMGAILRFTFTFSFLFYSNAKPIVIFPPSISLYLSPSHVHILFFQSTINSVPRWSIWPRNIILKVIELSSLGHRSGYVADSAVIADRFLIPGHWAHATRLSHPFLPEHIGLSRSS